MFIVKELHRHLKNDDNEHLVIVAMKRGPWATC